MTVVLIADDEPSLRQLVRATIRSDTYEVVEAADGTEAWRLVQQHRPAVAVLDVQMPGLSGIEVLRLIKNDTALRETKVIMLTSKAQEADIQTGLAAGADRYLTKPFSPLELLNTIDQALRPS